MASPLVAVPNFSEGRSVETIEALRERSRGVRGARCPHGSGSQPLGVHACRDGCGARRCTRRRHRVRAPPRRPARARGRPSEGRRGGRGARRRRLARAAAHCEAGGAALADRVGGELELPVVSCTASRTGRVGRAAPARWPDRAPATDRRRRAHARPRPRPARSARRLCPGGRPAAADRVQRQSRDRRARCRAVDRGRGPRDGRRLSRRTRSRLPACQPSARPGLDECRELAGLAARGDRGAYRRGGCSARSRGCRLRARRPHAGGRRPSRAEALRLESLDDSQLLEPRLSRLVS